MSYEKGKETKEKIIYYAKKSFNENGFKKTTMRSIASDVGIPQSLLYYYFEGKHAIAHTILDKYFYQISKIFNQYYNAETDHLLYLLVIVRLFFREVSNTKEELEFYYDGYSKVYNDRNFDKHVFLCLKRLGIDIPEKKVFVASIMANAAWSELVIEKQRGILEITNKEIRDNVDIIRWSYLGLSQNFILEKIEEAYSILDTIPELKVPLL